LTFDLIRGKLLIYQEETLIKYIFTALSILGLLVSAIFFSLFAAALRPITGPIGPWGAAVGTCMLPFVLLGLYGVKMAIEGILDDGSWKDVRAIGLLLVMPNTIIAGGIWLFAHAAMGIV
tara:strand:- start:116 stop:475 length:360 start_codon:yes stop_codon:yes gene_type:complete